MNPSSSSSLALATAPEGFLSTAFDESTEDDFLILDDSSEECDTVNYDSQNNNNANANANDLNSRYAFPSVHEMEEMLPELELDDAYDVTAVVDDNLSIGPRRSILKKCSSQLDIPVSFKRRAWKSLPKPDMNAIKKSSSMGSFFHHQQHHPSSESNCNSISEEDASCQQTNNSSNNLKKSVSKVSFTDITVRDYNLTLGDNPSVSYGPPVSLDWDYQEKAPVRLDTYEEGRGTRKKKGNMRLSYNMRELILKKEYGHSEAELAQAKRNVDQAKRQRDITKLFLPISKVEDLVQSAGRKAKRALAGAKNEKEKERNEGNTTKSSIAFST